MIQLMDYTEVENMIFNEINVKILLTNRGRYYKIESENFTFISWIEDENIKVVEGTVNIGLPIIEIRKNKHLLMPCLISVAKKLTKYKLSWKNSAKISHGNSVSTKIEKNKILMVTDPLDRIVAIAKSFDGLLTPLFDIGFYLRNEN